MPVSWSSSWWWKIFQNGEGALLGVLHAFFHRIVIGSLTTVTSIRSFVIIKKAKAATTYHTLTVLCGPKQLKKSPDLRALERDSSATLKMLLFCSATQLETRSPWVGVTQQLVSQRGFYKFVPKKNHRSKKRMNAGWVLVVSYTGFLYKTELRNQLGYHDRDWCA